MTGADVRVIQPPTEKALRCCSSLLFAQEYQAACWAVFVAPFYWLNQIQGGDRKMVGNKALNLAMVGQAGFSTISGFVVSAAVLRQFLATVERLEPLFVDFPDSSLHIDTCNSEQLMATAKRIRQAILGCDLPDELLTALEQAACHRPGSFWILRPSLALDAPPGQRLTNPIVDFKAGAIFESVVRPSQQVELALGLKQIWAQLFSARSLLYWERCSIRLPQVKLAVLIQPLYPAIATGVAQVLNQRIEIAAVPGLGTALIRGEAQPDRYRFNLQSGELITMQAGNASVRYHVGAEAHLEPIYFSPDDQPLPLDAEQFKGFVQQLQKLERQFGQPLEVEWVLASVDAAPPDFWLTQVTPDVPVPWLTLAVAEPALPVQVQDTEAPDTAPLLSGISVSSGQALAQVMQVTALAPPPGADLAGKVLVAKSLPASWLPLLSQVAAVVTEQGSLTCHGAIIAREVGIPAVMGVAGAMAKLVPGCLVHVDGDRGCVSLLRAAAISVSPAPTHLPFPSTAGLQTQLMVNLSQPESLPQLAQLPIAGVGLLRSELLALSVLDGQHPDEWLRQGQQQQLAERLANRIQVFAAAMTPRPVFYRCMDLRSYEFQGLQGSPVVEVNPMLGKRGTWRYQNQPELLQLQLRALMQVQQAGYTNLRLLLPFVRTVEEFQCCHRIIGQSGLLQNPDFQVWIMAEVPSVIFLLPDFVEAGVQGISIGTNDLTQLLLGVDRDQPEFSAAYNECHSAVRRAIAQLAQTATQLGIPCSICGQVTAHYPQMIEHLIQWGVTSISVEPGALAATQQAIAQAEQAVSLPTQK